MRLNVNPTRMELTRLKRRLVTAQRGHKLLKDKQDELIRRFIELIRRNDALRREVEAELSVAFQDFMLTGAETSPEFLEEAVMFTTERVSAVITAQNMMGVTVPKMAFQVGAGVAAPAPLLYGFAHTTDGLDRTLAKLRGILEKLLRLAELEKTCDLMAVEIEKTRRRVNALEYMTIPQLEETIKYIRMKLDENERGNLTRLMKVKRMIEEQGR